MLLDDSMYIQHYALGFGMLGHRLYNILVHVIIKFKHQQIFLSSLMFVLNLVEYNYEKEYYTESLQ